MKIKRILCPIDFSEFSSAANRYASLLAEATGAEIVYLHSIETDLPYVGFCDLDVKEDRPEEFRALQKIHPTSGQIECSYTVCHGGPADAILDYAKNKNIDLIVMGTHGRSGIRRALMGSVAEAVIRHSTCPVLALKHPSDDPEAT